MKKWIGAVSAIALALAMVTFASAKNSSPSAQVIDAGSFGVFVNGKRVATETFRVEQHPDMSVAKAELKVEGAAKASQTAEIQLFPSGDLRRYEWQQMAPEKSQVTVLPNDEFLMETIDAAGAKPQQIPHLLPHSTAILDDNFFSQRELLAWRYMAAGCSVKNGATECRLAPTQYGVLIPAQHTPTSVSLELKGKEKVEWHGKQQDMTALKLDADGQIWMLYMDDEHKLDRILVPSEGIEVVRD